MKKCGKGFDTETLLGRGRVAELLWVIGVFSLVSYPPCFCGRVFVDRNIPVFLGSRSVEQT